MITGDWACFSLQDSHRFRFPGWNPIAQLISCGSCKFSVVRVAGSMPACYLSIPYSPRKMKQ